MSKIVQYFDIKLINSQLPHNQLKPITDLKISDNLEISKVSTSCWKTLFHFNGFVDANNTAGLNSFLKLLDLVDCKYSFDLEGISISVPRLLEAYSSENNLNDENAKLILKSIEWKDEIETCTVQSMSPSFLSGFKRQSDFYREKKELRVQSYFTNLCLYTTPNDPNLIQYLRNDLNKALINIDLKSELQSMAIIHYQIRALSPYVQMNGHVARTFTKVFLREIGLLYHNIPLSTILIKEKEAYNAILRDILIHGNFEKWIVFIIYNVEASVNLLLQKTKQFVAMRRKFKDQIEKYTDYILPADELLEVIFNRPYIKPKMICERLDCHRQTAYTYLNHLVKMGLLLEKSSGREKLFLNKEFADLLN